MERLKQIIKSEEVYNNTINTLTDLVLNNIQIDKTYTIDSIQIVLYRLTNTFLLYDDCERIYDDILNRKGMRV